MLRAVALVVIALLPLPVVAALPGEEKVPPEALVTLARDEPAELIVLFADAETEREAEASRAARGLLFHDTEILRRKAEGYRAFKARLLDRLPPGEVEVLREYAHLPMGFLRFRSAGALATLAARPEVVAFYPNVRLRHHLAQSLPLIHQPAPGASGKTGAGTTIAVLDTGVDYTSAAFGCTAPGVPAGCKVVAALDTAPEDSAPDADGHGTSVAAIAIGVAPGAKVAAVDVFDGSSALSSDIIEGIDWAIANQSTYNIVAINMSLGDGSLLISPCTSKLTNPFRTPIQAARSAGILTVVSSGNDGFTTGMGRPACTPEAISVGAVYDASLGSQPFPPGCSGAGCVCTDTTTGADKVTCFSNTASYLTLLAPGSFITAAGRTYSGTSESAPHVAGAIGVLRAAFPADTVDETVQRMTSAGVPVTDTRPSPSITKPRLDFGRVFDADGDGLLDDQEASLGTNPSDADTDDDGLADGVEDANRNGVVDAGETSPLLADTDGDGLQDGTERGVTAGVPDPDGAGPLLGTSTAPGAFVPDADPLTTTSPTDPDTDGDGFSDGAEDLNRNGRVDAGEYDPADAQSFPPPVAVPAVGAAGLAALALLLAGLGGWARRRPPREQSRAP